MNAAKRALIDTYLKSLPELIRVRTMFLDDGLGFMVLLKEPTDAYIPSEISGISVRTMIQGEVGAI